MTTEDDFQAALDANPEDWQTRLVFADWLQERNDPRAEGYRALGVWRLMPHPNPTQHSAGWWWYAGTQATNSLPWFDLLPRYPGQRAGEILWPHKSGIEDERRRVEDVAALAFAKLSPERRAELLRTEATA